jgi:hypothetical protein
MGEAPTQGYSFKFTVETGIWSKSGWEMGFTYFDLILT